MGLPIACIEFCVLNGIPTMQKHRVSAFVLPDIKAHMGNAGGVVGADEKYKVAGLGLLNAGRYVV